MPRVVLFAVLALVPIGVVGEVSHADSCSLDDGNCEGLLQKAKGKLEGGLVVTEDKEHGKNAFYLLKAQMKKRHEREFDAADIGNIFGLAATAVTDAIQAFKDTVDPQAIILGIQALVNKIFEMLSVVLPSIACNDGVCSPEFQDAYDSVKQAIDNLLVSAHNAVPLINEFAESGDIAKLSDAVFLIIEAPKDIIVDYFPEAAKYYNAAQMVVIDTINAVGQFMAGQTVSGIQNTWNTLLTAVNMTVPAHILNDQTYKTVTGVLDHYLGNLDGLVLEFEQQISVSNVCYKVTRDRPRDLPTSCQTGYKLSYGWCYAGAETGGACWDECAPNHRGRCQNFCGAGRACCKRGGDNKQDPEDCWGAGPFHIRSSDHHQCVVMNTDLDVRGCYGTSAPVSGDQQATCGSRINHLIQYGQRTLHGAENKLCTDEPDKCAQCCKHHSAALVEEVSMQNSSAVIDKAVSLEDTFAQKGEPRRRRRRGQSIPASCSSGTFLDGWCYDSCQTLNAHFFEDGTHCKQNCHDPFPHDFGAMCAKTEGHSMQWILSTIVLGAETISITTFKALDMQENGEAPKASDLIQFIDQFKLFALQFANPSCVN